MMDPERVSNLDKACENAQALALDVLSLVPAKTAAAKSAKAASAKAVATKPAKKAA
jgi:chromosome partitioning protein